MAEPTTYTRASYAHDLDEARLRDALRSANIPSLLMVVAHLTGDDRWLRDPYRPHRPRGLDDNDSGGLPEHVQDEIREAALCAVRDHRAGRLTPAALTSDRVAEMLETALDEDVPREYGPLLAEELGVRSRDVDVPVPAPGRRMSVVIIGAGLSGLCLAAKLHAAGIEHLVLEKNSSVGGTWLENTYPGCGVDTPSHLYSFSFAPNSGWSRYFAKRDEVSSYLEKFADDLDVRRSIRFDTEVLRADWNQDAGEWAVQIRTSDNTEETLSADILVSAVGMVNRPSVPHFEGLDDFAGPAMHTAQWRSDVELAGKTVGVLGTGASAMQLVPSIADTAGRVIVFQRSKQWALPHPNYQRQVSEDVRYVMDEVPFYLAWYRLRAFWNFSDRLHPALQIDPDWEFPARSINADNEKHRIFLTEYIKSELGERSDLIDQVLPDYPPYGKRPLIDNGWFRAVCRDDVDLVTDAVAHIGAHSITTTAGAEYEIDVLVLATGFKTLQFLWPMEIRGRSGETLREMWGRDDARAYLGMTVPDFPNFFILNGPNTNAGHGGSAIISTEFQTRYVMQILGHMLSDELASIEIRADVFNAYNHELDEALSRSIWSHQGMTTYYRNDAGRIVISSPWKYLDYWTRTREADMTQFEVHRSALSEPTPAARR